jgi:HAE1 family hydrophobic/amphiphilic exporter-1
VIPLEEEINGVEGMTYINGSKWRFCKYFCLLWIGNRSWYRCGNVQNRVARATSKLPSSVVQTG